jgi:hypothetical protein
MSDQDFPSHSFDLFFDIKSREQLVREYAQLKQELARMDSVMASHGMEFTEEEMAIISPEAEDQPHDTPAPSSPKPF